MGTFFIGFGVGLFGGLAIAALLIRCFLKGLN
jgi:hypothetical protein